MFKVILTFQYVDEILKCDIQIKAIEKRFQLYQLNIMQNKVWVSRWNPKVRPFKRKAIAQHVRVVRFIPLHKIIPPFLSVGVKEF